VFAVKASPLPLGTVSRELRKITSGFSAFWPGSPCDERSMMQA